MSKQNKVTGVVLAGGMARRMGRQDKGLVLYRHQALVNYALWALSAVADDVMINANRNIEQYQAFGYPVISDLNGNFEGPLAGILAAMSAADTEILLVTPCDTPLVKAEHLHKLLARRAAVDADIAVACDGERLHPVFLALRTSLKGSLEKYLQRGERKVERWLQQHSMVRVDFSDEPDIFININTLNELDQLQQQDAIATSQDCVREVDEGAAKTAEKS
ncbi:molybdenum cofactor guanylyltransferase MobA [Methylomarinum sp. Ch1-1]|uniref:Molybdenum cofactor guanylyltransferase n=1 Tax=Methylomarinum roseum TaxID=3067653 RepID=A0AAU7NS21_9GAMM|nr:molybdenum cofactor guanylyltransferase MobA [Methylomarinum sp. Ch1-1]MDP4520250.1 molybdenum cofactor guanylyltransferase MobA [Methylomarinum sp. Ch1-1]